MQLMRLLRNLSIMCKKIEQITYKFRHFGYERLADEGYNEIDQACPQRFHNPLWVGLGDDEPLEHSQGPRSFVVQGP
jgi:hypothetical protein